MLVAMAAVAAEKQKPNVIFILADDIGFGDVGCNGATAVKTPNVDRLAKSGINFTDGHAPSATCTPTRYSLMTGEYPWRKKGTGILPGDAKLIIDPARMTLPKVFKQAGYTTGCVGKWHLGLGDGNLNWNKTISPGPNQIGFDHSFHMAATGDRVPCVFIEDGRVVDLAPDDPIEVDYLNKVGDDPTGKENPELLKMGLTHGHDNTIINGISRIGWMKGGKAARWKDEDMADTFTGEALKFIESNKDKPFFLYFATHDIHVPRVPNPRFVGKTTMGPRGDAIVSFDDSVRRVMETLEKCGIASNTIVVLSSDNGPVLDDGYADGAVAKLGDHKPAGPFKGGKYSLYEGGTREPFIVSWPGRIKPGESDALVCQMDLLASFAAMLDVKLPADEKFDSQNILPALLGESKKGRDVLIEHTQPIAIRMENWKYIPFAAGAELYDLSKDAGEEHNVIAEHADIVAQCVAEMEKIRDGRDDGIPPRAKGGGGKKPHA
jgi:arylsulfatase A-like enzyme